MPQCVGMNVDTTTSRRWIQLRYDLYAQVQKHVHSLLGESSSALLRYQREYDTEVSKAWKAATRDQLLEAVQRAQIVWLGDFHALQQSQKAQLRILKALPKTQNLLLGLECIEAHHQAYLDKYLQGKLTDREFLKAVEWKRSWGFPWEHYKPLFRWAIKNKVRVYGLNLLTEKRSVQGLRSRDEFSGKRIVEILRQHPKSQMVVIFGDLHLAQKHLPAVVTRHMKNASFAFVFQNPEKIYFQLLKKEIEHQVDIVQFSKSRFGLLSVPPWVKWQNYLLYLEAQYDKSFDDDLDLTDYVAKYVKLISEDLGVQVSTSGFSVASAKDRGAWTQIQKSLSDKELEVVKCWIEDGRSFFLAESGIGYLGRPSVNSAAQLAMAIVSASISGQKKIPSKFPADFVRMIWLEAVQYFGSKLINPKRKTDTLADVKATLAARNPFDQGKEAMQLALSQKMLELLHLSQGRKERDLLRPRKKKAYLEAARILGGMMGEKLYYAYRRKLLSRSSLLNLLKKPLDTEGFSNIYWEILEVVENFPEPFQSKTDKM
jgi:uncharacterized iron-regulated protein